MTKCRDVRSPTSPHLSTRPIPLNYRARAAVGDAPRPACDVMVINRASHALGDAVRLEGPHVRDPFLARDDRMFGFNLYRDKMCGRVMSKKGMAKVQNALPWFWLLRTVCFENTRINLQRCNTNIFMVEFFFYLTFSHLPHTPVSFFFCPPVSSHYLSYTLKPLRFFPYSPLPSLER